VDAIPASNGYLLVDSTKCTGCSNCMLICSLVHEGTASLSLARLHVIQEQLVPYPHDVKIYPCRQCVDPLCLTACSTGALHVDVENGNVRVIDEETCTGCGDCYDSCPYDPKRIVWHVEKDVATKCDLCIHTPHWRETGGPAGKQACIMVCPVDAIGFTGQTPAQRGISGYEVDLRQGTPE